ncbi:hypothetical protein [Halodesulfovibrio sp.]|nr:hypothetical protein [Halodesulfovibrio sp.]
MIFVLDLRVQAACCAKAIIVTAKEVALQVAVRRPTYLEYALCFFFSRM